MKFVQSELGRSNSLKIKKTEQINAFGEAQQSRMAIFYIIKDN